MTPTTSIPDRVAPVVLRQSARAASARDQSRLADQRLFASVLSQAVDNGTAGDARTAAEDFVAQALVQPVLKQMREMGNAQAPFAPGRGEKMFRTLLDNALSQRIVQSGQWALVDRVAERIAGGQTPGLDAVPGASPFPHAAAAVPAISLTESNP